MIFKAIQQFNSGAMVESLSVGDNSTLLLVNGFNLNAANRYLHIFANLVSPPSNPPVNGSIPANSILVAPNTNFSFAPAFHSKSGGLYAPFGFIFVSSTTPDTLTRSLSNDFWIAGTIGVNDN